MSITYQDAQDGGAPRDLARWVPGALLACALACLALQVPLALAMSANWDEFHYLAQVHEFLRGDLHMALQTIHVHLFRPIAALGGGEVSQIEAGRLVMIAAQAGTFWLIYRLARLFLRPVDALFALLAYATLSNTVVHGASFRVDPLATVLVMAGLVAAAHPRAGLLARGVAILAPALAAMVTVKVVLYAPAFLGILVWQASAGAPRRVILRWAVNAAGTLVCFGLLYVAHRASLSADAAVGSSAVLANAAKITLLEAGLLPRLGYLVKLAFENPLQGVLLLGGGVAVVLQLFRHGERAQAAALLLLAAPIGCVAFYSNAFPYFYPFILPPVALLAGAFARRWLADDGLKLMIAVAMTTLAVMTWNEARDRDQALQRSVLANVHAAFPEPVAAFDRNGMVSSFPRAGFFMSQWGMKNYAAADAPFFREVMLRRVVPLLVVNGPALRDAVVPTGDRPIQRLDEEDRRTLAENYLRHAPHVWVAGKKIAVAAKIRETEFLVPGAYRVSATAPFRIDGRAVADGAVVTLERGTIALSSPIAQTVRFKWNVASPATQGVEADPVYAPF